MARDRFPKPQTTRLPLSDGEWIEVKRRLTAGEYHGLLQRQYVLQENGRMQMDIRYAGLAQVLAYVTDWSLSDGGKPVPFSEAALMSTDIDTFREIKKAVEAHDEADEAARSAEKNDQGGPTA